MISPEQDAAAQVALEKRSSARSEKNRDRIERQEARNARTSGKAKRYTYGAGMLTNRLSIPKLPPRDVKLCIHCCGMEGDSGFVLKENEKGSLFHVDCPKAPNTDRLKKRAEGFKKQIAIEKQFNKIKANHSLQGSQL